MQLNVAYNEYGLHVRVDGVSYVSNLTMPDWSPKADWKLGFGARSFSSYDKHWLNSMSVKADSFVSAESSVDLQVSINGQQYTKDTHTYTYYAAPVVYSFSPNSGPM